MKPFLKWAGGKLRLVEQIKNVLPNGKRFIEPFVGSGAVFLNAIYPTYILADVNSDLINLYLYLQRERQQFIDYCRTFFTPQTNNEIVYYQYRTLFNTTTDLRQKSALFIYLNRHCFNGLCRYNSKGKFNVPFGSYNKPHFPEIEMRNFSHHSQNATFRNANFLDVMEDAEPGDILYCDPPYAPLSATANFTSYSRYPFGLSEQKKLVEMAEILANNRITVIISNHDTEFTREIYINADKLEYFEVQRHISCDGSKRSKAAEILAVFDGSRMQNAS